jgi:predicted DNA-binding transcriptional regulator YafY
MQERIIEPVGLFYEQRHWYIQAIAFSAMITDSFVPIEYREFRLWK